MDNLRIIYRILKILETIMDSGLSRTSGGDPARCELVLQHNLSFPHERE
jgi:hypothetical protein